MKEINDEAKNLIKEHNICIDGLSNKRIKKIINKVKRKQKWKECNKGKI